MVPSNVRKNKETTECGKSTVTCDVSTTQCDNEIIKCDVLGPKWANALFVQKI